jgi:ribosomal protein S8
VKRLPLYLNDFNYKKKLKVKSFKTHKNKFLCFLSKFLEKFGFLSKFLYHLLFKNLKIFLSFTNHSKPVFQLVISYYRLNRPVFMNYKEITRLRYFTPAGIFVFSTNQGLVSDVDCLRIKTGGTLLFWIY